MRIMYVQMTMEMAMPMESRDKYVITRKFDRGKT